MKPVNFFLALLCGLLVVPAFVNAQIFKPTMDPVPSDWNGPVFELSRDYPQSLEADSTPWMAFDFRTDPLAYMNAVLDYCLEGNIEVDFRGQDNAVRKWFHAPNMADVRGGNGREFIHGTTRERSSRKFELHPNQDNRCSNWAVGLYNPAAGYAVGRVWEDTLAIRPDLGIFPPNAVGFKLLFTTCDSTSVPYLSNSFRWLINEGGRPNTRQPTVMRLLQLDISVKDPRATETGWVFGTFVYHADAEGETPFERCVPAGLMWGNDPGVTNPDSLKETWINPEYRRMFSFDVPKAGGESDETEKKMIHLGYGGRLNGPVDNPISSCLSCHATAKTPFYSRMAPRNLKPETVALYFRNVKGDSLFDKRGRYPFSMDYSLQNALAIRTNGMWRRFSPISKGVESFGDEFDGDYEEDELPFETTFGEAEEAESIEELRAYLNSVSFGAVNQVSNGVGTTEGEDKPDGEGGQGSGPLGLIIGAIATLLGALGYFLFGRKKKK